MASDYTSGNAASFADLLTALENFLTTVGGWATSAGVGAERLFSKGDLFARIGYMADRFYIWGGTGINGTSLISQSSNGAMIGNPGGNHMTFPISYEIYWSDVPEEVYIVVNYNGDKYQHLNFGKSDIEDVGGTGMWYSAAYPYHTSMSVNNSRALLMFTNVSMAASGAGTFTIGEYDSVSGGFFLGNGVISGSFHSALNGSAMWAERHGNNVNQIAAEQNQSTPLLLALPSLLNETEVLLPLYITMNRAEGLDTIASVFRHARLMRLDNVSPEDIITYGGDQWKCYPLYAKNTEYRNGRPYSTGTPHSGTIGIALRYPGA